MYRLESYVYIEIFSLRNSICLAIIIIRCGQLQIISQLGVPYKFNISGGQSVSTNGSVACMSISSDYGQSLVYFAAYTVKLL